MSFADRIRSNDPEMIDLRLTETPEAYCTDMSDLIDALSNNTSIEVLRLDRDFLPCMDPSWMNEFFLTIGRLSSLKEARIWHAAIPVKHLADFIHAAQQLVWLEFGCLDLGGTEADFTVVSEAIRGHPTLEVFKMCDFSLSNDDISVDGFVESLATVPNLKQVKIEVIHARRVSVVGAAAAAKQVKVTLTGPALATLVRSTNLEDLTLNRLNLQLDDYEALAEAIKTAPSLKCLALPHCNLDDTACDYMAKAIGLNTTLEKLDFSCNRLTDEGCMIIATALEGNTTVKLLRLWGNVKISNTGFDAIAEMLEKNVALERVPLMAPLNYRAPPMATASRAAANRAA